MLLVTDIGADVDDTQALLVLLGAVPRLVGVVTSCNNGLLRGAVIRGWLRRLGIADELVPIMPSVDGVHGGVSRARWLPAEDATMCAVEDTPRR